MNKSNSENKNQKKNKNNNQIEELARAIKLQKLALNNNIQRNHLRISCDPAFQLDQQASKVTQQYKEYLANEFSKLKNKRRNNLAHQYYQAQSNLENAFKTALSFNIAPQNSLKIYLKKANYANSINEALAKDWEKVSQDLNTCLASALHVHIKNTQKDRESDECQ